MERKKQNLEREIARLLDSREWHTDTGAYLRSEQVCIAIRPYPADEPDTGVNVPLAVLPLKADVALLEGIGVTLTGPAQYTGTLNVRGQATFLHVTPGMYRAGVPEIAVPAEVAIKPPTLVERFLAGLRLAIGSEIAFAQTTSGRMKWHDEDSSLVVSISEYDDKSWLSFVGDSESWANRLALFGHGKQLYLVALDAEAHASIVLDNKPEQLRLPPKPYPVNQLTPDWAEVVDASVRRAATVDGLRAWQNLARHPDLCAELRTVIEDTVNEKMPTEG